jgi:hypothetical protein
VKIQEKAALQDQKLQRPFFMGKTLEKYPKRVYIT